ncbi:D-arabinono-1,4-lactone oxidase [Boothiomyces macroporosus]|uniref:D-arabinono-1,4-lactone oxidase n=1 Tax=Boothiomyces macroporosus TaxID=261099 RepID=A0AAD5XZR6_9FUNG|nr:D-arabinono-1,4-lactone oxidase [Boothiomyces macroporosus]
MKNWARQYEIKTPITFVKEEEDIPKAIKAAISNGTRVRAMGSLYNFANVVEPMKSGKLFHKDHLLSLEKFNKVVSYDEETGYITCQAGMKLKDLNAQLELYGRLLPNYGNVDGQKLGGLISTGTHGRSLNQGSFSSSIKSLTLYDGNGNKHDLDFDSTDPATIELCDAVGLSVGMLGIISVITFKTVPLYYLRMINSPQQLDWVIENWQELNEKSDYVEISYFPILDMCIVGRSEKLILAEHENAHLDAPGPYKRNSERPHYLKVMLEAIVGLCLELRHIEMDICFDFEQGPEFLKRMRQYFKENPKRTVNPVVDIRCSKEERFLLSGAHKRRAFWADFLCIRYGSKKNSSYHQEIHNLFKDMKFKRHWGKHSCMTPEEVQEIYGENLEKFLAIKQELDPKGTFKNKYLENLLGNCCPNSKKLNPKMADDLPVKSSKALLADHDD